MQSSEEEARAAALLEKLLTDDEFRAAFRMDPAGACAAYDLPELVEEFSRGAGQGKALHTLEIRESRSSLAGAFMAAASEGTGAVNHLQNIHDSHLHGQAHRVVGKALTAHKLHAVDPNHLHGGGAGVHELVDSSAGGRGSGGGGAVHLADQQSVQSVLHNSHLQLSPEAHAALVRGGADVRLVGVLEELSKDHNLRIGTLHVGHGGAGSFEILTVDGERVSQTNIGARDLANELASLDPSLRPGHIVTPWPIDSVGFSTSGAHEDRIQIIFETPPAGGHAPAVVEQSVAAAPAAAAPAVQVSDTSPADTGTGPPEPSTPTTPSTPSTPPAASTTPPEPATIPPAPSTTPPEPSTPSTPSTTPPAPSTTPPAPSTTPPAPSTTPPAPSTTPPAPSTTPPSPADTSTPEPSTTPPAPSTTPPAPSTPPAAPSPPATPAPPAPDPAGTTTPPPAPTTTPVAPTTAPVEPGTAVPAAAPSHQSLVLGAVQGTTPADHQTLSFQVSDQHAAGTGGPGEPVNLSAAAAFDPNAPGGLPDASDTYPGDDATKAQIAAWMGRQAHKAGLPAELPIMAALTESGLTNVNHGDRDSLGFFQMRTGIWNQGEYAGFPDHPELQLKWFIDHAVAVRQQHLAAGDTNFGQDKNSWGDWVADVERPAEEYRYRYQTHLAEADGLLAQAGATGGTTPGADPLAITDAMGGAAAGGGSTVGVQALMIAERFKGTPYVWGGASPETGFDCSGLVQWSYKQMGIDLPRVTTGQFEVGTHISTVDELKAGDIVFFKDSTGYIHHEGIYIGNHMFLHAPHTGDVVKVSSLDEPYYAQQFAGGSDVTGLAHGAPPPGADVPQVPPGGVAPPVTPAPAAPAAPATPDPGAADVGDSTDGGAADGLFDAIEQSQKGGSHSTVQILPAVQDPNETSDA